MMRTLDNTEDTLPGESCVSNYRLRLILYVLIVLSAFMTGFIAGFFALSWNLDYGNV
jgi:hypothetical protein